METRRDGRMHARDWAIVLVITLLYAALALWNLGDMRAAQNGYTTQVPNEQITFDFGETESLSTLQFYSYSLTRELVSMPIEGSLDGQTWFDFEAQTRSRKDPSYGFSSQFCWQDVCLWQTPARYVRITVPNDGVTFFEMAFTQTDGARLMPVNVTSTAPGADLRALFDEQDLVPEKSTFMNSTYFDEIYHARTSYELLHGLPLYETTHPPLGKVIIEACIAVLGMTPFAWRLPGTLAGVLMLPVLYAMAKLLFRRRDVATFAMLVFALDCMHYAQTRIATIDSFELLFILVMFYFLFRYVMEPDVLGPRVQGAASAAGAAGAAGAADVRGCEAAAPVQGSRHVQSAPGAAAQAAAAPAPAKAPKPFRALHAADLLCAGLAMGLACATKWIGFYAAVGAVFVLFAYWIRLGVTVRGRRGFWPWWGKTAALCVVFFLLIPFCIYFASFAQYYTSASTALSQFWNEQVSMLSYHTQLVDTHYYASPWNDWPVDFMPMLFYSATDGDMASAINTMGNPIVWWAGLVAMIALIVYALWAFGTYLGSSQKVTRGAPRWRNAQGEQGAPGASGEQGALAASSEQGAPGALGVSGASGASEPSRVEGADGEYAAQPAPAQAAEGVRPTQSAPSAQAVQAAPSAQSALAAQRLPKRAARTFPHSLRVAWLIAVGYLCLYVPWMLVPRLTFIYHYFACTPFLALALAFFVRCGLSARRAKVRRATPIIAIVFLVVVALAFALFFPVISGLPVPKGYIDFTRWLPWWIIWC